MNLGIGLSLAAARGEFWPQSLLGFQHWLDPTYKVYSRQANQFVRANKEYLTRTHADQVGLNLAGTNAFTIAGWFRFDSVAAGNGGMCQKYSFVGDQRGYELRRNGDDVELLVSVDGVNAVTAIFANVVINTWYFVVALWDGANVRVFVNDAAGGTNPALTGAEIYQNNVDFFIGRTVLDSDAHDGKMQHVAIWRRALTAAERTALYAASEGMPYESLTEALKVGLVSWWELSEDGQSTRVDRHGPNHLTAFNTPTATDGLVLDLESPDESGIKQWTARAAASTYVEQVTFGLRPTYESSGVRALLDFDGVDDLIPFEDGNIAPTANGFGLAFVTELLRSVPANESVFGHTAGTDGYVKQIDKQKLVINNGAVSRTFDHAAQVGKAVHIIYGDSTGLKHRMGGRAASNASGTSFGNGFTLNLVGKDSNAGSHFFRGLLSDIVFVERAGGLLEFEVDKLGRFLSQRHGLTWGVPAFTPAELLDLAAWAETTSGVFADGAIKTDGVDDYVRRAGASATSLEFDLTTQSFSLGFWVKINTNTGTDTVLAKYKFSTSQRHYIVDYNGTTIGFFLSNDGVNTSTRVSKTLALGTWAFILCSYDHTTDTVAISKDGDAAATTTFSPAASAGKGADFVVGADSVPSGYSDCEVDSLGVWSRILTAAEKEELKPGGATLGKLYADLSAGIKSGLISWWDFNEATGTRRDRHGTNHLDQIGGAPTVIASGAHLSEEAAIDDDGISRWQAIANVDFAGFKSAAAGTTWPKLETVDYSRAMLVFDGATDYLDFDPASVTLGSAGFAIAWVSRLLRGTPANETIFGGSGTTLYVKQTNRTTTVITDGTNTRTYTHASQASTDAAVHIISGDATNLRHWLNGGSGSSAAGTSFGSIALSMLGRDSASGTHYGNIALGDPVLLHRALTIAEVNDLGNYLATQFGTTWNTAS